MSIADKLAAIAENEQNVYNAGKQNEHYNFWNVFQNGGDAEMSYQHAFSGTKFTDANYNPIYPLRFDSTTSVGGQYVFYGSSITDTKVEIITGQNRATSYCFANCKSMHTIRKFTVNAGNTFTDTFSNCTALVNIEVSGVIGKTINFQYSPLSKASIKSVINALSETTSGVTVSFSKTAVNNAFGIDVDDESTFPEGSEFYILRNSKSNWTFNYV